MTEVQIPPETVEALFKWVAFFQEALWGESPLRIHQRALGEGGTPEWHPEFAQWMKAEPPRGAVQEAYLDKDQRLRITRTFRKLRRKVPREFDVLYMLVVRKPPMSVSDIKLAMNQRAERLGHPERYETGDILVLAISALDKAAKWY